VGLTFGATEEKKPVKDVKPEPTATPDPTAKTDPTPKPEPENPCPAGSNSNIPGPDCRHYTSCKNGLANTEACTWLLRRFNKEKGACDWWWRVKC